MDNWNALVSFPTVDAILRSEMALTTLKHIKMSSCFMLIHQETGLESKTMLLQCSLKEKLLNLLKSRTTPWLRHVFTHGLLPCYSLFLGPKVTECSEIPLKFLNQAWCATRIHARFHARFDLYRNSRQNNCNQPNSFNLSRSKAAISMQTAIFFTS